MNTRMILVLLCFQLACMLPGARAQESGKSIAEKLGFARDAKLLIIHADDVGMTHSVNAATIKALEAGAVNSASIMVPCPWFPEIADYAKTHSDMDFGLHLTLTSERVYLRWGPVASKDKVPSLVDQNGYFHHDWSKETHIDPGTRKSNCARRLTAPTRWASAQHIWIRINTGSSEMARSCSKFFSGSAMLTNCPSS